MVLGTLQEMHRVELNHIKLVHYINVRLKTLVIGLGQKILVHIYQELMLSVRVMAIDIDTLT